MVARAIVVLALSLTACSGPADDGPGCLLEEPPRLGDSCGGDGECGEWLVCESETCAVPPAVLGEGGTPLEVVADGEVKSSIDVEIARSDVARERGLSHRPCIEPGWGLLIEFPSSGDHLITTAEMRFDLDVAMAGEEGVIHTVHRDVAAGGSALLGGASPVHFVLETRAGEVDVIEGDRLVWLASKDDLQP